MNWFTYAWERLQSTTPLFFKKLIAFGISLAVIGTAILAIPVDNFPIEHANLIKQIGGYLLLAGTISSVISKLTTTDNVLSEKSSQK